MFKVGDFIRVRSFEDIDYGGFIDSEGNFASDSYDINFPGYGIGVIRYTDITSDYPYHVFWGNGRDAWFRACELEVVNTDIKIY